MYLTNDVCSDKSVAVSTCLKMYLTNEVCSDKSVAVSTCLKNLPDFPLSFSLSHVLEPGPSVCESLPKGPDSELSDKTWGPKSGVPGLRRADWLIAVCNSNIGDTLILHFTLNSLFSSLFSFFFLSLFE